MKCPECDNGYVMHHYQVPDCCGKPGFSCCGVPTPVDKYEYLPCETCQGTGEAE